MSGHCERDRETYTGVGNNIAHNSVINNPNSHLSVAIPDMSSIMSRVIVVVCAGVAVIAYSSNGFASEGLTRALLEMMHLSSFSIYVGMTVWVTFVSGIVMFHTLPRHTFGIIQSK